MIYENEKYQPIEKAARKLWIIHACISALIVFGITIGIYFILYRHLWIFGLAALDAVVTIFIMPAVQYRQWRYFIGPDRIEIIHGIFFYQPYLDPD